jgi:hypothetical protein
MNTRSGLVQAACVMTMSAGFVNLASADDGRGRIQISTGAYITPLAAPGFCGRRAQLTVNAG